MYVQTPIKQLNNLTTIKKGSFPVAAENEPKYMRDYLARF